jgi:beta-lactamase superfamily II metal-dependent hydrolase
MFSRRTATLALAATGLGACTADDGATIAAPAAFAAPAPAPPASAWTDACEDWDDWDKPAPPFRIHGNSYHVGTCGITAVLITGDAGHVLIDGATEKGATTIAANIERLGFRLADVKLLLHSHEHHDHVGGIARLQALTGALSCDILLTPHPSSSQMRDRLLAGSLVGDGKACRAYADTLSQRLDERLAKEATP